MLFSMHTDQHIKDAVNIFGYAYGYTRICEHFNKYQRDGKKLSIVQNSPRSQVQMFYMEPEWYNLSNMTNLRPEGFRKFHNHQYKIYGTHLEATKTWSHWIDTMNKVDEIWVGNQFAAESVINSGVTTPTYVFEHGIDDMWKPFKRGKRDKIRFLHVDSGSPRKRADLVEQAFITLFGNNPNAELTLKYHSHEDNTNKGVSSLFSNVKKIYKTLSQDDMVDLFYQHDVLVYPSEGEGFGFIPLQALATGMPVISTGRWCSYEKYIGSNIIESKIGPTTYTGYFEGEVVLADFESLLYLMSKVYNNIDDECDYYFNQAQAVYDEYNWQNRCNDMLDNFIDRVGIDLLEECEYDGPVGYYLTYTGNGSYSFIDGTRFSWNDRVKEVSEESFKQIMPNPMFRLSSDSEIESASK